MLSALETLWNEVRALLPPHTRVMRLGVTLFDLTRASERQLDMLLDDDPVRLQWERITEAIDALNRKHGRTLVSIGPWTPPPGGGSSVPVRSGVLALKLAPASAALLSASPRRPGH